jgi:rod shape-determining protein MreD
VRAAFVGLALAVALALQTTVARQLAGIGSLDLVLVVVIYVALSFGPVPGLVSGSVGGLAQDVLSGGIVGVGGLAKCIVGFVAGVIGMQFIVAQALPRFLVFFCATVVQAACFFGLYAMLKPDLSATYTAVVWQALANALVGILAFQIRDFAPGMMERRRASSTYVRTRRLQ